jgi:hypothetical protein
VDQQPRGRGRPPWAPTEHDRATARTMAAFGVPREDIARAIGVDAKTLRRHMADEIEFGGVEANAKVAQALFRRATGDGPQSVVAAIFWLKARADWRDRPEAELRLPGRKEAARLAAENAEVGTPWETLLRRDG